MLSVIWLIRDAKNAASDATIMMQMLQGSEYELIIINDDPHDPPEFVTSGMAVEIRQHDEAKGLVPSFVEGADLAHGDELLFLESHYYMQSSGLEILRRCLSEPGVGAVAPVTLMGLHNWVKHRKPYQTLEELRAYTEEVAQDASLRPRPVLLLDGGCMLVRREAYDAVQGFDPRYTSSDCAFGDFTLRLLSAGWQILSAENAYLHKNPATIDEDVPGDRARFREKLGFDIIYSCFTRRELLHYVDLSHQSNAILDVGCSCGGNLCQLHTDDPSAELYGIEFNKHAAAIARHFASVDAIDVETLHRPEWHDKFQNIILADLLEHLRDPWQALRNMYRITRPGGRIIISIPNIMHISILRSLLNSDWNYADAGILDRTHLRFFTRKTATAMVTGAGYHILQYGSSLPGQSEEERSLKEKLLPLLGPDASADDLDAYQWHIVAEK